MENLGKYEILEKIGEGGFGAVYKARDPHLKRIVALKTCSHDDEDLQRRFLREGEIVASLQHPNITLIHDLGFEGGTPFLVQEFLSGEDLAAIIERRDELDDDTRIAWMFDIARGLEYAHDKGIVHRDIKPANIRILEDRTAKIMDFGIAKLAQHETRLTKTGSAMGTIAYMSPEQLDGSDVDHRSDIFAFGVLSYELFAFTRPFEGETTSRIVYQILHAEPRRIDTLPARFDPGLDRIFRGCLAKEPAQRFQSFGEVLQALERLLAGLPPIDESTVSGWSGKEGSTPAAGAPVGGARPRSGGPYPARGGISRPNTAARLAGAATHGGTAEVDSAGARPAIWKFAAGGAALLVAALAVWMLVGRGERPSATTAADPVPTAPPVASTSSAAVAPEPVAGEEASAPAPAAPTTPSPAAAKAVNVPAPEPAAAAPATPPAAPAAKATKSAEAERQGALVNTLVERAEREAREARAAAEKAGARDAAAADFGAGEEKLSRGVGALAAGKPEAAYDAFSAARADFEASGREAAKVRTAAAPRATAPPPAPAPTPAPSRVAEPAATAPAAATQASAESEIRQALDRYVAAYERLDADAVIAEVPSLVSRRGELERAFGQYRSLDLALEGCRIDVAGERATATCNKRQSFELKVGQGRTIDGKATFRLVQRAGRWTIDAVEG
ncbi:MAG: protein kinase [Thermoanaerobaculia bacterium]